VVGFGDREVPSRLGLNFKRFLVGPTFCSSAAMRNHSISGETKKVKTHWGVWEGGV
jgi:hypothetical protein